MTWGQIKENNIVKTNGQCYNRGKWLFCPYWMSRINADNGRVEGYRCRLFEQDKEGYDSLDECNNQYGTDYEGLPT